MNLTAEDEALLDRLRDWLAEARTAVAALPDDAFQQTHPVEESRSTDEFGFDPQTPFGERGNGGLQLTLAPRDRIPPGAPVAELPAEESGLPKLASPEAGLFQLAEEFTALRQELKLQTKSARNLQEQTEQAVAALHQSLTVLHRAETQAADSIRAALKPREDELLDAYMNLDDALERGHAALTSARQKFANEAARPLLESIDAEFATLGWWSRRVSSGFHQSVRAAASKHAAQQASVFDSVLEGYRLIQNRLQKAMKAESLERIPCVGLPVDPNCMNVVEIVVDASQPSSTVVAEIRRGYRRDGQIVRFAEVAAVK